MKNVFLLIGGEKQRDQRKKLAALQNVAEDEDMVVVATGKYIGEGFDSPRLDTLLLAMPISWKGTLAQYAGRLHKIIGKSKRFTSMITWTSMFPCRSGCIVNA